jgi:hypothetical protein
MKIRNSLLTVLLILILFGVPTLSQEGTETPAPPESVTVTGNDADVVIVESPSEAPPWAAIAIPPALLALMAGNNRFTEMVKIFLNRKRFTAWSKETKSTIVLVFSILLGIGAAYLTPNSGEWLGAEFVAYPYASAILTGVGISTGGAIIQVVIYFLDSFRKLSSTGLTRPNG